MNNQIKIINLNINGSENDATFKCNVGLEINNSLYELLFQELATKHRQDTEFNAQSHKNQMLKLRIEELKLLKELRELEK